MCKNKKGSVVLLVAILSVLSSVVGISLYEMTRSMHKSQVIRNKFTQYHLLTLSLRSIISRPDVCTLALQNQIFDPTQSKSSVNIASSMFEERKFIGNIEDISNSEFILLNQGFTTDKLLSNSADKLFTYRADLQVWLPDNTAGSEAFNYEKLNIYIPLYVNIDKNNNIRGCYGVYSKAALCERYWKSWNPSESNIDIQCNPDRQCILYTSTTCDPPSVKMAIGSFQSSTQSANSQAATSALGVYASVGRSLDRAHKGVSLAGKMMKVMKGTFAEMKEIKEQTREALDNMEIALNQAQVSLQQAQAALSACQNACCGCGGKIPGCCGCDCSGQVAAVAAAQASVNQLQAEFDMISEVHNNMEQALAEMEVIMEIAEVILTAMRLGIVKSMDDLATISDKLSSSSHYPKHPQKQQAWSDLLAQKQGIESRHLGGKDMFARSNVQIENPVEGSIFDEIHNPHNSGDLQAELDRIVREDSSFSLMKVRDGVGSEEVIGDKTTTKDGIRITDPMNFLNVVYGKENAISGLNHPSLGELTEGPNTISNWREGASSFQSSTNRLQNQNQLFYHNFSNYASDVGAVAQFASPGTTVIQTNMKYMCLWCNEERKEEFKSKTTDPILSKN